MVSKNRQFVTETKVLKLISNCRDHFSSREKRILKFAIFSDSVIYSARRMLSINNP